MSWDRPRDSGSRGRGGGLGRGSWREGYDGPSASHQHPTPLASSSSSFSSSYPPSNSSSFHPPRAPAPPPPRAAPTAQPFRKAEDLQPNESVIRPLRAPPTIESAAEVARRQDNADRRAAQISFRGRGTSRGPESRGRGSSIGGGPGRRGSGRANQWSSAGAAGTSSYDSQSRWAPQRERMPESSAPRPPPVPTTSSSRSFAPTPSTSRLPPGLVDFVGATATSWRDSPPHQSQPAAPVASSSRAAYPPQRDHNPPSRPPTLQDLPPSRTYTPTLQDLPPSRNHTPTLHDLPPQSRSFAPVASSSSRHHPLPPRPSSSHHIPTPSPASISRSSPAPSAIEDQWPGFTFQVSGFDVTSSIQGDLRDHFSRFASVRSVELKCSANAPPFALITFASKGQIVHRINELDGTSLGGHTLAVKISKSLLESQRPVEQEDEIEVLLENCRFQEENHDEMQAFFAPVGELASYKRTKGVWHVRFRTFQEAYNAVAKLHDTQVLGTIVRLRFPGPYSFLTSIEPSDEIAAFSYPGIHLLLPSYPFRRGFIRYFPELWDSSPAKTLLKQFVKEQLRGKPSLASLLRQPDEKRHRLMIVYDGDEDFRPRPAGIQVAGNRLVDGDAVDEGEDRKEDVLRLRVPLPSDCIGSDEASLKRRNQFRIKMSRQAFAEGKVVLKTEFQQNELIVEYEVDEVDDAEEPQEDVESQAEEEPDPPIPPRVRPAVPLFQTSPPLGSLQDVDMKPRVEEEEDDMIIEEPQQIEEEEEDEANYPPVIFPRGISKNYLESAYEKDVDSFVKAFFDRFTSNRRSLLNFYGADATFSYRFINNNPSRFDRNSLVRLPEISNTLSTPPLIVNETVRLVAGEADPLSWDALPIPEIRSQTRGKRKTILLTVHGVFTEFPGNAKRSFDRTFVLIPKGTVEVSLPDGVEYLIKSDALLFRQWDGDFPHPIYSASNAPAALPSFVESRHAAEATPHPDEDIRMSEPPPSPSTEAFRATDAQLDLPLSRKPTKCIYVGKLDPSASREAIMEVFAPFGTVRSVNFPGDRHKKTCCFVNFLTVDEAEAAMAVGGPEGSRRFVIANQKVRLDYAEPLEPTSGAPKRASTSTESGRFLIHPPAQPPGVAIAVPSPASASTTAPSASRKRPAPSPLPETIVLSDDTVTSDDEQESHFRERQPSSPDPDSPPVPKRQNRVASPFSTATRDLPLAQPSDVALGKRPASASSSTAVAGPSSTALGLDLASLIRSSGATSLEDYIAKAVETHLERRAAGVNETAVAVPSDVSSPASDEVDGDRRDVRILQVIKTEDDVVHGLNGAGNLLRVFHDTGSTIVCVSSSGHVLAWNARERQSLVSRPYIKEPNDGSKVEEAVWHSSTNRLLVGYVPVRKDNDSERRGSTCPVVIHTFDESRKRITKTTSLRNNPYELGVNTLDVLSNQIFVTGGSKKLFLWTEGPSGNFGTEEVISARRTNTIVSTLYHQEKHWIFSGGNDTTVLASRVEDPRSPDPAWRADLSHKLTHIQEVPFNPNLILARVGHYEQQFKLLDIRTHSRRPVVEFGFQLSPAPNKASRPNLGRFVKGSFWGSSAVYAFPSNDDVGDEGVKLWDLRNAAAQFSASKSAVQPEARNLARTRGEKRVFQVGFGSRKGEDGTMWLASMDKLRKLSIRGL